jgi:hypothetical protein
MISHNRGGMGAGGLYLSEATLTATNLTLVGNSTVGNNSTCGGLDIEPGATVNITGLQVANNATAFRGGGVCSQGTLTITDSTIAGNSAGLGATEFYTFQGGGGIFVSGGTTTLTDVTITGNGSYNTAGLQVVGGLAQLTNVTVSGNRGSGVSSTNGGSLDLTNVTIADSIPADSHNVSRTFGIFVGAPSAVPSIPSGTVHLRNTVLFNSGVSNCGGPVVSLGHNLSSDTSCARSLTSPGDQNGLDPKLGPLASNDGPTQTRALLQGSPAIDAASNANCPSTDQRGQSRPIDGNGDGLAVCDVGAYELQAAYPPATACSPRPPVQVTAVSNGDGRLRVTLSASENSGQTNVLQAITWTKLDNAAANVVGVGNAVQGQRTSLPANTQSVTLLVSRVTPGQATTVNLTVTDACGDWPTFVGGGPSAF